MAGCRIEARDTENIGCRRSLPRSHLRGHCDPEGRYFFARKLRALGFPLEPRCLEIAARNSVMDGVPNACDRFRDSGKPVTGFSRPDLSKPNCSLTWRPPRHG
jgi:hypothetical protein